MKKTLCYIAFTLCFMIAKGQQFAVSYSFEESFIPQVISGSEALTAGEVVRSGEKLKGVELKKEQSESFAKVEIQRNIRNLFYDANLRFDLSPKAGCRLHIESVKFVLRGDAKENDFLKFGASLSKRVPENKKNSEISEDIKLTNNFKEIEFRPQSLKAEGLDDASIWITGRGRQNALIFDIKEVVIRGKYEKSDYKPVFKVSDNIKQNIILGIDAERLWHWREEMKEELAQVGVGEMKSDFVRVAITSAYEREKGVKDESVYEPILALMQSMKDINPNLKFFASPRPLFEAYSNDEKVKIWGHKDNVPWAPYPTWVFNWVQDGTKKMSDGSIAPKWIEGKLDMDALVQFYADYLNYMYGKNFEIAYLDVTNEKHISTLEASQYLRENLPKKLNKGIKMPKLIVPSSWNTAGAIEWLKKVDMSKNQQNYFDIVSTHNTAVGGTCDDFMAQANRLGKEAWNTELHAWVGVDNKDEVLNSDIFWEHMRAGFNGIDTWLFYGPAAGRGHTMVWVDGKENKITRSTKYEIFKQIVNNATSGNYVDISMPFEATTTSAFIKDNVLSVWVLNKSKRGAKNAPIDLSKWNVADKTVELTKWGDGLPRAGIKTKLNIDKQGILSSDIDGESLYFFKIKVNK